MANFEEASADCLLEATADLLFKARANVFLEIVIAIHGWKMKDGVSNPKDSDFCLLSGMTVLDSQAPSEYNGATKNEFSG
jgi:hypothetical protein